MQNMVNIGFRLKVKIFRFYIPWLPELQIVSVPLFIVSGSYTVLLKSKANQYYSLSRIAESEEMAKVYYEKTRKYDSNAYISGGVSLVSAFNIIRSTLRKKSLSAKMYKTINQGYIISK